MPGDPGPGAASCEIPDSNYVLDLHGNPESADLVIFAAGNQYMVFPELIAAFTQRHPSVRHVFYATTPPGLLIRAMDSRRLVLGNFWVDLERTWPDVFMTGPRQQRMLRARGWITGYFVYAHSRGVGLLVRKGNPLAIASVRDCARPDVRVAISSAEREPASHDSYAAVITSQGGRETLEAILAKPSTRHPARIHHRENPQLIADGLADVAPMFAHFGRYLTAVFPDVFDFVPLPEEGNRVDAYGAALVDGGRHPEAARVWIDFLRTDASRAVFERHGFQYASATELGTFVRAENQG